MINKGFLISFPTQAKSFAFGMKPRALIKAVEIIPIRRRLLPGISQYDLRNGFSPALSKSARFRRSCSLHFRLYYITVLNFIIFESAIFREWIFMWGVSPGCGRLVPTRSYFLEWNLGVDQHRWFVPFALVEEIY